MSQMVVQLVTAKETQIMDLLVVLQVILIRPMAKVEVTGMFIMGQALVS